MKIRPEHLQAFSDELESNFEADLQSKLRDFVAPTCLDFLGEVGFVRCVRYAVIRAHKRGFTLPGPVHLYAQALLLLGADFEHDPLMHKMILILECSRIENQCETAAALHKELMAYCSVAIGSNSSFARAEFSRAKEEMRRTTNAEDQAMEPHRVLESMKRVFAERFAYAGGAVSEHAVRSYLRKAEQYSVVSTRSAIAFCGLAFAVGWGFDEDPRLPWIREWLNQSSSHRLIAGINTWLTRLELTQSTLRFTSGNMIVYSESNGQT